MTDFHKIITCHCLLLTNWVVFHHFILLSVCTLTVLENMFHTCIYDFCLFVASSVYTINTLPPTALLLNCRNEYTLTYVQLCFKGWISDPVFRPGLIFILSMFLYIHTHTHTSRCLPLITQCITV